MIPSLLLAGASSNAGKTVTMAALLCALQARGFAVRPAKTGPDYIDAAWHTALCGAASVNLDTWMAAGGPPDARPLSSRALRARLASVRERLAEDCGGESLLLVEGAMGLFDGAAGPDGGGDGSSARLAALCAMPVVLLINVRGMGQSAAALAEGFFRFRPSWMKQRRLKFLGVICTHVGSERHAALLRDAFAPLERRHGIPLLGCLPRAGAPDIASRHLGLIQAQEAAEGLDRDALERWLEEHVRLDCPRGSRKRMARPFRSSRRHGRGGAGRLWPLHATKPFLFCMRICRPCCVGWGLKSVFFLPCGSGCLPATGCICPAVILNCMARSWQPTCRCGKTCAGLCGKMRCLCMANAAAISI